MRTIGFIAIVVLLVLPPPAAAADGAGVVNGPRLAAGDTWTYQTNTSLAGGLSLDGRITLTVTSHGTSLVEGRTYDSYIMSVSGRGTAAGIFVTQFGSMRASGDWSLTGREVVDVRSLKVLSTVLDLEANGTLHTNPVPLPFALSVQNTTTYGLEADSWQFPLTVGATAVVSNRMNFAEDFRLVYYGVSPNPTHSAGVAWWNVTYALEVVTGIDTPAGHFDAYPIREMYPDGSVTISFYAPVVGNYARTEARNGTSSVGSADLASYRYQALEPPTVLGLTTDRWAFVAIAIGAVGIVLVWFYRRRKRPDRVPSPPPSTP